MLKKSHIVWAFAELFNLRKVNYLLAHPCSPANEPEQKATGGHKKREDLPSDSLLTRLKCDSGDALLVRL
jgi:hypothetical protein